MLDTLDRIAAQPHTDTIDGLVDLVQSLRPAKTEPADQAASNVRTLMQLLKGNPQHSRALRHYLLHILTTRYQASLYTDTGILSNDGFFTELFQRLSYRILPPAIDEQYLRDCLDRILPGTDDYLWIRQVPTADWLALFDVLATDEPAQETTAETGGHEQAGQKKSLTELLEAIQTLSYRISAMGLEPMLIRNHPALEAFESPFLMQNIEARRYLEGYFLYLEGNVAPDEDTQHLLVMLDQCDAIIVKIRKSALRQGSSVALTYLLVRLTQSVDRMRKLLFLVELDLASTTERRAAALDLGIELVEAHNRKYAVRELFASNINLLARNITENASRTGEHYVAENHAQQTAMFRAGAGAGFIIGFMALIKILASYLRAAPLVETFLYSMNYSLGFMLIHVLHFTVATKQPAMTASRIAAELHSRDGRTIDLDSLVELMVKVARTQFAAVLGNVMLAIPVAYLIAWAYFYFQGQHLVTPEKAEHLLQDINPIHGATLFYAAIAGVGLFLSGLISGYYDNKAAYTNYAQRIVQLRGLRRLLGAHRLQRLSHYLDANLGGLMGNFYFGIFLGSMGMVGFMLGLPLDIRHITFSAANYATALVGLEHQITWQTSALSIAGILSIGAVNLWVSFSLALFVALRSRQVRFAQGRALIKALLLRFLKTPGDFFTAPKEDVTNKATP